MVPKEAKISKEGGIGRSYRPVGPQLYTDMANRGFLSY